MSMMNWPLRASGALLGHGRRRGLCGAGRKNIAVDLVHGDERGGHAGSALKEAAAVEALFFAKFVGHGEQPRFNLALSGILRIGIEFVAGDDLGRIGARSAIISDGINCAISSSLNNPLIIPLPDCVLT